MTDISLDFQVLQLHISMLQCSFSIFYNAVLVFLPSIYLYLFRSQSIFFIFTCSTLRNM